jgi:hypothetical protein
MMEDAERRAAQDIQIEIPAPKVEVIAETRRNKRRPRFERHPSEVPGIGVISEPETNPTFTKGELVRLQADSDRLARWRKYEKLAKPAKKRLVGTTKKKRGFRGIVSERGNYESPLIPKEQQVVWDPDLLKQSTGAFYVTLVREGGRLIIEFPSVEGQNAREELNDFAHIVAEVMIQRGRDPKEVGSLITPIIVQRLDEEELNRHIAEGDISPLLPGTRKSTVVWEAPTNVLDPKIAPKRQRPENLGQ